MKIYTLNRSKLRLIITWLGLSLMCATISCKKFVSIDPPVSQLVTQSVFEDWKTANATITAIYSQIPTLKVVMQNGTGAYADEFIETVSAGLSYSYFTNSLGAIQNNPGQPWNDCYRLIYQANAIVEGCQKSKKLSDEQKRRLTAEARFTRSFLYFYLVNLYGGVPLLLSTDYMANRNAVRASENDVYIHIINELNAILDDIDDTYLDGNGQPNGNERVRPNNSTVKALLSRVYLYNHSYELAEAQASDVLDNKSLYDTVKIEDVFLKNQKECIWSIPPSNNGPIYGTEDARTYIININNPARYLTDRLLSAFEANDLRKQKWIGVFDNSVIQYSYPHKYKKGQADNTPNISEYTNVLRVGEMYLIRAEARAQLGDLDGAKSDLGIIRERAGLPESPAVTKEELLLAVFQERQVELFTEWCHRWFDIRRSDVINQVMEPIVSEKGGQWQAYKKNWPIAQTEIDLNPNLTQNPGYTK